MHKSTLYITRFITSATGCLFILLLFSPETDALAASSDSLKNLSVEKRLELIQRTINESAYQEALDQLNYFLHYYPDSKDGLLMRAQLFEQLDKYDRSLTDYNALLYLYPDLSEAVFSRGRLRYESGQYQLALDDFRHIKTLPEKETRSVYFKSEVGQQGVSDISTVRNIENEINNYIGLCYAGMNRYQDAIDLFTDLIDENGDEIFYYLNRAQSYEGLGNTDAARKDYQHVLNADPDNFIANFNLSRLNEENYLGSESIQKYSGMIDDNPFAYEAYSKRALLHYNESNFSHAVKDYSKAIELNDSDPNLWYNRGLCYAKQNKTDSALYDFNKAIELKKDFAEAYFSIGNLLYKSKDFDAAISFYDLATNYQPQNPQYFYNRGIAKFSLKKNEEACIDLDMARKLGYPAAEQLIRQKCSMQ